MAGRTSFVLTNVKDGFGRLQVRAVYEAVRVSANLGYLVSADKWDAANQLCRANTFHGRNSATQINKAIRAVNDRVGTLFAEWDKGRQKPSETALRGAIKGDVGEGRTEEAPLALRVLLDFCQRQRVMQGWSENTAKKYHTIKVAISGWDMGARIDAFDSRGLESFYSYLQCQGYVNSTIAKYIVNLKSFLRWSDRAGYPVSPDYREFRPRVKTTPKTIVWLTWEELMRIESADLPEELWLTRSLFLFSCFTGMRFSDLVSLLWSDIHEDSVHLSITKTAESVVIGLNRHSRRILAEMKGKETERVFPSISNPYANRCVKRICELCGISEPTTETWYEGAERKQRTSPKHELITMHTGRRTFICNALEKGISPQVVMSWTGHKSYEEMKPYIAISDKAKETAMKLFDID